MPDINESSSAVTQVKGLQRVLDEGAFEAFVANAIVMPVELPEPNATRWVTNLAGALTALMAHAGLDDRRIDLQAWTLDSSSHDLRDQLGIVPPEQPFDPPGEGTLVEYAGTDDETSLFVFDHRCTASHERMLAAAALAVAEAFREAVTGQEAPEVFDEGIEYWASALGFGVLLVNGSHVVETWSESQASVEPTTRPSLTRFCR